MASDREILREVWEGKIAVCFKLDSDEVADLQQPDPMYLLVPRLSYFPLVVDKVRKHFSRYVSGDKTEQIMWLEYGGEPLKWHYPIGVLFDLLVCSKDNLVWNITVHFDKFPVAQIYSFNNKDSVEAYFMACLKEADMLKHKTQMISNMQIKDQNQLWTGLLNDKFDQFWLVNIKLMEASADEVYFKYIPFRCYLNEGYKQKLVKPCTEEGDAKILKDLLDEVFPGQKLAVKTHGIPLPLDTPLQWMSQHLSYPDNFLHLCIHNVTE